MGGTPVYLHAGFLLISSANLVVIALLVFVFALAVAWPQRGESSNPVGTGAESSTPPTDGPQ
jgi:hypothetical protein